MKLTTVCLLLLMCCFHLKILSQNNNTIQLKITDKYTKELLFGANIQWLQSSIGATTNEYGIAILELTDSLPKAVVISYIGYLDDTVFINNRKN